MIWSGSIEGVRVEAMALPDAVWLSITRGSRPPDRFVLSDFRVCIGISAALRVEREPNVIAVCTVPSADSRATLDVSTTDDRRALVRMRDRRGREVFRWIVPTDEASVAVMQRVHREALDIVNRVPRVRHRGLPPLAKSRAAGRKEVA